MNIGTLLWYQGRQIDGDEGKGDGKAETNKKKKYIFHVCTITNVLKYALVLR